MRIISFSSKLNAKSRDVILNIQFSVNSFNYLTNKALHRSQSLKSFIRQRFYRLQGFQKQVASSLISTTLFWKDSMAWFWNTLRQVQTVGLLRDLYLHFTLISLFILQHQCRKRPQNKISSKKCSSRISCVWNQSLHWALDPSYYRNKLVIP